MSQPVKLSDELVLDARLVSEIAQRSIAGQIEYWAALGRAIEPLLLGDMALALRKSGDDVPLSELIDSVDSPAGRRRVADYLAAGPFPHYEAAPNQPGFIVRTEEDGSRVAGRFVGGHFQVDKRASRKFHGKRQKRAE